MPHFNHRLRGYEVGMSSEHALKDCNINVKSAATLSMLSEDHDNECTEELSGCGTVAVEQQ